ncbi:hypothetical protein FQA39_LY11288 [Lamprigera yunnana]|nr:hypothetical protein FQA39_LY11288 [Lamprigera yunnana]
MLGMFLQRLPTTLFWGLYSIEKAALIDTLHDTVGIIYQNVDSILETDAAVFDEELSLVVDDAPENYDPCETFAKDIPPRSDQVVEIEEIVQTVPELEDSALFLDNPPRGEQIIEEIEIVQTEPQLQLSVSHTDNENQPDNQDGLGPSPEPATAAPNASEKN